VLEAEAEVEALRVEAEAEALRMLVLPHHWGQRTDNIFCKFDVLFFLHNKCFVGWNRMI
jgi:hypothetical protein